ncbi:CvpA family protein [Polaribacter sp.]|nr:CvpA family protein [Polaribacter sp.]
MNSVDIVISVILLFGFIRGLMKGFFVEVASLVGLIAGVYGAIHFSYFAKNYLQDSVDWKPEYITLIAFAITFVAIVVAIALLGKVMTKIADFAALGMLNKLMGGIFGCLKLALILSVILLFLNKLNNSSIPFIDKEDVESSILYEPIQKIVPFIFPIVFEEEMDDVSNVKII